MEVGIVGTFIAFVLVLSFLDILVKVFYKDKKRPSEIVVIAILLVSFFLTNFINLISGKKIDPELIFLSIINLIWLSGFWNMKKWGVIGYIITIIVVQIITAIQHQLTPTSVLVVIEPLILLYFYPKMK